MSIDSAVGGRPTIRIDLFRPLTLLFVVGLFIGVMLPLGWLLYTSFLDTSGNSTLENYVALVTDPSMLRAFARSVEIAIGSGALCAIVATPLAWLVARTDLPARRQIRYLVMASFVTPPFLGAIAWEILGSPNSGFINVVYRTLIGGQRSDHLINVYTFTGLVCIISCYTFPYVFTLVSNGLARIPSDLEDASAILGAPPLKTFTHVTIPLVLPALLAGSLIAMLQALTMFGAPAILALPAGFDVLTTKIWSLFQFPPNVGLAAATAVPLLLITVGLLQGKSWLLGKRDYKTVGGRGGDVRVTRLGPWKAPAIAFAAAIVMLTIILPYLALIVTAFTTGVSAPASLSHLTLNHFRFVFLEYGAARLAIWNTFYLGILTATLGAAFSVLIAYVVSRRLVRGARILEAIATVPIAVPAIVLGVGLFLAFSSPAFRLYGTLWILLIAFLVVGLPTGYQQMSASLQTIHPELEEASRMLGRSRLGTLWRITIPLLNATVVATWCFFFVGTIRELSAAILLTTSKTTLISVLIYNLNENGDYGSISVLGILLLFVSFVVIWIANKFLAKEQGRRA